MISFSVSLPVPRAALYDYLSDPKNRPAWQSSIRSLEMLDEGPVRRGMRWRETARGFGTFEMAITEHNPVHCWAETGKSPKGEIELTLRFDEEATTGRTQITVDVSLKLRGIWGMLAPLAGIVLRPLMKRDLRRAGRIVSASR